MSSPASSIVSRASAVSTFRRLRPGRPSGCPRAPGRSPCRTRAAGPRRGRRRRADQWTATVASPSTRTTPRSIAPRRARSSSSTTASSSPRQGAARPPRAASAAIAASDCEAGAAMHSRRARAAAARRPRCARRSPPRSADAHGARRPSRSQRVARAQRRHVGGGARPGQPVEAAPAHPRFRVEQREQPGLVEHGDAERLAPCRAWSRPRRRRRPSRSSSTPSPRPCRRATRSSPWRLRATASAACR